MVISSASESHRALLELLLRLASVGTFLSFSKLCYFTFFARNEKIKAAETLPNMQLAMMITAFFCILVGIFPGLLCSILPYPADYHAYTFSHVAGVPQLFLFAGLVFMLGIRGFSPHRWLVLDFDYFYRMAFRGIAWVCSGPLHDFRLRLQASFSKTVGRLVFLSRNPFALPELVKEYERSNSEGAICGKPELPYDENAHRKPMGLGVLLAILFLFIYGLIYLIGS